MRPGLRVGKYVLGERIAQGGMAEVWAGRVEGPEGFVKPVALKFILETFSGDTEFERLFVNEARVAAQLQHANLVTIFDFDKMAGLEGEPGRYYIAMERVDGHDLRRVVQSAAEMGRFFPHALALHVAGEMLKGLRYVHERRDSETGAPLGLVHRDVSPHNVLVGMGGEVKVSDFGIAKAMAQSLGTKSGTIRGKLSYASPEQLRAEAVDHRTDQFALGITVWEMLTQRRLFDGMDEVEIIGKVLRCEIPFCDETPTGPVAPEVEQVVRRMLAPARDDRYPTTAAALSAVLALPGYTHDGAALSELMRSLWGDPSAAMNATVRLDAATPPPWVGSSSPGARGGARTPSPSPWSGPQPFTPRSSPSAAPSLAPNWSPSLTPGRAGSQGTRTVAAPEGMGLAASGPARGGTPRPGTSRRPKATGYVSDDVFEGAYGRRPVRERPLVWPWVVGAVALLGVGLGAFLLVPGRPTSTDRGGQRASSADFPTRPHRRPLPEAPRDPELPERPVVAHPEPEEPIVIPPHEESPPPKVALPPPRKPSHPASHASPEARPAHLPQRSGPLEQPTQPEPPKAPAEDAPPAHTATSAEPEHGPNGAPIIKEDGPAEKAGKKPHRPSGDPRRGSPPTQSFSRRGSISRRLPK